MKNSIATYGILALVFTLSVACYFAFPAESALRAAAGIPGIGALLYALFQLARDQAAHEKQLQLQSRQFQFSIGSASHMANVAFDKHAEFCEKYLAEMQQTARTLFREGDTPVALEHAWKLHGLREESAAWLTDEIDRDLGEFEKALRELGANAHFIRSTTGVEQYAKQRSIRIDKNFEEIKKILGISGEEGNEISETSTIDSLKKRVRNILNIEELSKIREHLLQNSHTIICGT
tara:strand:- start:3652 stop:4356 length:705 start_codon:yes stop_codon:yes gene_type:complete